MPGHDPDDNSQSRKNRHNWKYKFQNIIEAYMKRHRFTEMRIKQSGLGIVISVGLLVSLFFLVGPRVVFGENYALAIEGRLAVMPVIKGSKPKDANQTLNCPLGLFRYDETMLEDRADQILTEILHEMLISKMEERVVPLDLARKTYSKLQIDQEETPLGIARRFGSELGVDFVIVGNVWRFRERVGTAYAIQQPASVAFNLYLVEMAGGKAIWQTSFVETQRSLSEDLLRLPRFFRRGAKWLTVEELARDGIKERLYDFPLQLSPGR